MHMREAMTTVTNDMPAAKNAFDKAVNLNYNRAAPFNMAINALAQSEVLKQDSASNENMNKYLRRFGEITNESFEFFYCQSSNRDGKW